MLLRTPSIPCSPSRLSGQKADSRFKSVIKRRARQQSAKRSREIQYGSLLDLEQLYVGQPEAEQRVYANEFFARLSPFAQSIVEWRWLGYSWRKIAEKLEMDHTAVRRAYFGEMELFAIFPLEMSLDEAEIARTFASRDDFEAWIAQRHQERVLDGSERLPVRALTKPFSRAGREIQADPL